MPSNKPEFSPSTTWLSVVEGISFPSASCWRDLPSAVVQIISVGSLSSWWDIRGSCGQVSHSCNIGVHIAVCSNYSSTCHRRPPLVQRKSGPSWQVAPRDRERTYALLCQIKHIHQTAYISQHMHNIIKHSGQLQCCIGPTVRDETNNAENV